MRFQHDGFMLFTWELDANGQKIEGTEQQHRCEGTDREAVHRFAWYLLLERRETVPSSHSVRYEVCLLDSKRPAMKYDAGWNL